MSPIVDGDYDKRLVAVHVNGWVDVLFSGQRISLIRGRRQQTNWTKRIANILPV